MQDMAKGVARQSAPWKPSQSWWVVGVEGIAALVIGIYVLLSPSDASDVIRMLIAAALLVLSAGQIVEGFRFRTAPIAPWATLRGGMGAAAALLALLANWWPAYIEPAGARQILALGLLVYGAIGIVSLIFTFRTTEFKIAALITDLLAIALGALLLRARADDTQGTQLLGVAAIVGGVALLIYGYMLWSKPRRAAASIRETPVQPQPAVTEAAEASDTPVTPA